MSDQIPNCPRVDHCSCFPAEEAFVRQSGGTHCVCGETEKALREWSSGRLTEPMTPEQREWCYTEIENFEAHDREDYIKGTDAELAKGVLAAWQEYCQDKGMI